MYLKKDLTPVKNQGNTNKCAVYAAISVVEWYYKKKNKKLDITEDEVYRMVKEIDNSDSAGTLPINVIKILHKLKKIRYYKTLPLNIYDINQAIESDISGVIGAIMLYADFKHSQVSGILSHPTTPDRKGWHTMHFVGYDPENKQFICKNSWGIEWGENGYLRVPYEYIQNNAQQFYSIYFK